LVVYNFLPAVSASLKTLTNSKKSSESHIKFHEKIPSLQFLFRLSFAITSRFSPVYNHGRLSKQFSGSQAAFGTTFKVTGGISWNKLPEEGYTVRQGRT
jgi:hypothetical protein